MTYSRHPQTIPPRRDGSRWYTDTRDGRTVVLRGGGTSSVHVTLSGWQPGQATLQRSVFPGGWSDRKILDSL